MSVPVWFPDGITATRSDDAGCRSSSGKRMPGQPGSPCPAVVVAGYSATVAVPAHRSYAVPGRARYPRIVRDVPKSRVRAKRRDRSRRKTRRGPVAKSSRLDPGGLPEVLFPADVTRSAGPDFAGLALDLVITSRDAIELMRVPLRFERRLRSAGVIELWGFDSTKAVMAHVRIQRDGSWAFEMRPGADPPSASQALLLLELAHLVSPANRVALTEPGTVPAGFSGFQDVSVTPPEPEGLGDAIRALARLENYIGSPIKVPETLDQGALAVTADLLNGRAVRDRWDQVEWRMSAAEARELAEGPLSQGPTVLDVRQPFVVDLGDGGQYELAPVWFHYRSVQVATWPRMKDVADESEVVVLLKPADQERAVDLLFEPAMREADSERLALADDPVTLVPAAAFDELVASLDVREEPSPALARAAARLRALRA